MLGPCRTHARLDRDRLARLMAGEMARFAEEHPRSATLHARARGSLLEGVPMPWMVKWAGPFPPYVESAEGAHFRCVDGHDYVDFCLGDTGAMAGHGPAPTIAAVERQIRRGITHMLPTEDAAWVGEELTRRFGVGSWQFALSASDANRWVLRLARHITGRSKVVVHDHCYHGSVDEAIAMLGARRRRSCRSAARSVPRSTSPGRPASSSSTMSTDSRRRWPTATSRPSCSSPP